MRTLVAMIVVLGIGGFVFASQASAQSSAPATFYGRGAPLKAGDSVAVLIGGRTCGSTTVNSAVEWAITVAASASCLPVEGVAVTITVNGVTATATPAAVWRVGGTPPDVANGYALTLPTTSATPTPVPTSTPAPASASLLAGSVPKSGGYGLIATNVAATVTQVVEATGCPTASMALYATVDGAFLAYVPGTSIAAVNQAFMSAFGGGNVPAGTPFIGKCA